MNKWLDKLKENKLIGRFFDKESLAQFLRYLIVGFSCFAIEYSLFLFLRSAWSLPELVVNIIVFTIIFWLNFLANRWFSFRSSAPFIKQMLSYGILFAFNLTVGNILLFSAIRALLVAMTFEGSWAVLYLPKIIIMGFIISWNFILYKKVIYK